MKWILHIRHRKMAPDLHTATFYANVLDLSLFLFDSRNYYMDCIRMDENHILCAKETLSAAGNRFRSGNYFLRFRFYCAFMFIFVLLRLFEDEDLFSVEKETHMYYLTEENLEYFIDAFSKGDKIRELSCLHPNLFI